MRSSDLNRPSEQGCHPGFRKGPSALPTCTWTGRMLGDVDALGGRLGLGLDASEHSVKADRPALRYWVERAAGFTTLAGRPSKNAIRLSTGTCLSRAAN